MQNEKNDFKLEASTMNSIWTVEKARATNYKPTLKESLFDFNLGYGFALVLALMFMTIGAYTVYGTGTVFEEHASATQFSNKLLNVFTQNLGDWSYYIMAIAAFGTIYGTLITVLDAFPRCFVRGLRVLRFENADNNEEQTAFLGSAYKWTLIIVGFGGFSLFYFSATSMVKLLGAVTIIAFLTSPVIAFLNLRAIQSSNIPESHRLSPFMIGLAYLGLFALVAFSIYYLVELL